MGWRRFGDHEDDPYYQFASKVSVLGTFVLLGNHATNGGFEVYGVPRVFRNSHDLKKWIGNVGFLVDTDLADRYGSSTPKT